jgi:hypothetical protein
MFIEFAVGRLENTWDIIRWDISDERYDDVFQKAAYECISIEECLSQEVPAEMLGQGVAFVVTYCVSSGEYE